MADGLDKQESHENLLRFWKGFFTKCGIKQIDEYAEKFAGERMQKHMIQDLNREILKEIGISSIGDTLAILKCAKEMLSVSVDVAEEETKAENVKYLVKSNSPSISSTKQTTLVVGKCGVLKVGPELEVSPEKEEIVTVDINMKDIESESQIYNTSQIDPSHKMYQYFTEMNKASLKLALDNPQLLKDKNKLQQLAREFIHKNGYTYKKKNSRSKIFGEGGDNKRPYVSEALKVKKIKEIQEDINDTDTQMALLTRQREKHINVKQFGQAATITDRISQLRGNKRKLENELTLIQSKKKHCEKQKSKTCKTDASRIQGAQITQMFKPSATVTSNIEIVDDSDIQDNEPEAHLESNPVTSENKESDPDKRRDPFFMLRCDVDLKFDTSYRSFVSISHTALGDVKSCCVDDGLYISRITMFSLTEFMVFREQYCRDYHSSSCKECKILTDTAKYIFDNGVVEVPFVYRKFFSVNYKTDKAVRRLMQLPVVIFRKESTPGCSILYVTEHNQLVDYKVFLQWMSKLTAPEKSISGLNKEMLSALCKLASTDKDRSLIKYAVCQAQSLSGKEAERAYGISSYYQLTTKVSTALKDAAEIRMAVQDLAVIEKKAFLKSLRIKDESEDEEDVEDSELGPDETIDIESDSGESEHENIEVSVQRNHHMIHESESISPSSEENSDARESSILGPTHSTHSSYDPDIIDKTRAIVNPAPANEVLIGWLRENDLNWFAFYEEVSLYLRSYTSEVLNQVLLDFTDFLPSSDLSVEEEKQVEISRQAFLETQRRLSINSPDIESDSDNDQDPDWNGVQVSHQLEKETLEKIQAERVRIKRRAKRKTAKQSAENSVLKRKVPPAVRRLLKKYPSIGKDMEEFVESKKVGADAWRRTGLLTFDGERKQGKKVTYMSIKEHLEKKYSTKFGYGSIVQLCAVRNKRLLSAKRYQGVAKITCRRARKGFSVRLNPDAHWSCALYKGLDFLQFQDGTNQMLLNRDDQSGFRLDTTYDHKHSKTITASNKPSLTTRTDFLNSYPSVIQTTSYLFMETKTTKQACVGVVKPHHIIPKNPAQHASDLQMLMKSDAMEAWVANKPIDSVKVDGATDEGPSHLEVQFNWTEHHIQHEKVVTLVTSRHSGGSYLNRVELMNGGLSQAHSNLFIPSTLSGNNYGPNGLDQEKLKENLNLATEVYIDRVQGASCCGVPVQLFKSTACDVTRRQNLLIFLKGSKKAKQQLKNEHPELYKYFQDVWDVRKRHMNKSMPAKYIFHLTLCGKPDCAHPRCKKGETSDSTKWFENGPSVTWLPIPVPDPNRPGHYMKPEDLVTTTNTPTTTPPSIMLKQAAKNKSNIDIEDLSQKVLLPVQEVKWHLDHYGNIIEKRKAKTAKKSSKRNDCSENNTDKSCIVCEGMASVHCSADPEQCTDAYCLECLDLAYPPPMDWVCPQCQEDTDLYCLCSQGEYGLMIGCDGPECPAEWFHLKCVGLTEEPKTEKWFCPLCSKKQN